VVSLARKPVNTRSQKEVSAGLMGDRKQFVDIALAITDMDDALGFGQQRCRLPHVLKPAITLLLFHRDACGVDASLERVRAMELIPAPELDRSQPEWKTIRRDYKTGVHQDSAGCVVARLPPDQFLGVVNDLFWLLRTPALSAVHCQEFTYTDMFCWASYPKPQSFFFRSRHWLFSAWSSSAKAELLLALAITMLGRRAFDETVKKLGATPPAIEVAGLNSGSTFR
jgi:hypothetical protein